MIELSYAIGILQHIVCEHKLNGNPIWAGHYPECSVNDFSKHHSAHRMSLSVAIGVVSLSNKMQNNFND